MTPVGTASWFKAIRSPEAMELIAQNRNAFILAYVIAARAQYSTAFNWHGLAVGESFIGDHGKCGMSEQEYRTAKKVLSKHGFATFKSTTKGTVAKLCDKRLFAISQMDANDQANTEATDIQRTPNGQPTDSQRLPRRIKTVEGIDSEGANSTRPSSHLELGEFLKPSPKQQPKPAAKPLVETRITRL